jgi:hypothetical protein
MPDVPVCGMSGCEQTSHRQVHRARTHTHRQQTATYRISNWTKQIIGEVVMHEVQKTTPEDGHTVMTETCRVLMMFLQNIF